MMEQRSSAQSTSQTRKTQKTRERTPDGVHVETPNHQAPFQVHQGLFEVHRDLLGIHTLVAYHLSETTYRDV